MVLQLSASSHAQIMESVETRWVHGSRHQSKGQEGKIHSVDVELFDIDAVFGSLGVFRCQYNNFNN